MKGAGATFAKAYLLAGLLALLGISDHFGGSRDDSEEEAPEQPSSGAAHEEFEFAWSEGQSWTAVDPTGRGQIIDLRDKQTHGTKPANGFQWSDHPVFTEFRKEKSIAGLDKLIARATMEVGQAADAQPAPAGFAAPATMTQDDNAHIDEVLRKLSEREAIVREGAGPPEGGPRHRAGAAGAAASDMDLQTSIVTSESRNPKKEELLETLEQLKSDMAQRAGGIRASGSMPRKGVSWLMFLVYLALHCSILIGGFIDSASGLSVVFGRFDGRPAPLHLAGRVALVGGVGLPPLVYRRFSPADYGAASGDRVGRGKFDPNWMEVATRCEPFLRARQSGVPKFAARASSTVKVLAFVRQVEPFEFLRCAKSRGVDVGDLPGGVTGLGLKVYATDAASEVSGPVIADMGMAEARDSAGRRWIASMDEACADIERAMAAEEEGGVQDQGEHARAEQKDFPEHFSGGENLSNAIQEVRGSRTDPRGIERGPSQDVLQPVDLAKVVSSSGRNGNAEFWAKIACPCPKYFSLQYATVAAPLYKRSLEEAIACAILTLIEKVLAVETIAVHVSFDGWLREQDWSQLRFVRCARDQRGGFSLLLGDRHRGPFRSCLLLSALFGSGPLPALARPARERLGDQAAAAAELAEWRQLALQQREELQRNGQLRTELRTDAEALQKQLGALGAERERLSSGGAAVDAEVHVCNLQAQLAQTRARQIAGARELERLEAELGEARAAAAEAAASAEAGAAELGEAERERAGLEAETRNAEDDIARATEERLAGMVSTEEIQRREAESERSREAIREAVRELQTVAAGSRGRPLQRRRPAKRSDGAAGAARVRRGRDQGRQPLEDFNAQLEGRIKQLEEEIAQLRTGAVDLASEEELLREAVVQQSETSLRRVEDLTDERKTADADRRQLLATAAELLGQVDAAETRVGRRESLESQCKRYEDDSQVLSSEVERYQRTNDALCQQVFGEDRRRGRLRGHPGARSAAGRRAGRRPACGRREAGARAAAGVGAGREPPRTTPRSWPCGCSSSWPSARRRSGWSARASRTAWPLWSGRAAAARGRC
ncbi:unnamed protein product [Prorocentrum cordatum]|uniref:Uncharacterized protein n=1 Tax=Prorocentrum cordatum TaxID=2364126 RepID=A0ABN9TWS3_9DINO|nr:unnamed protein product [Polarella glacialis]